MHQKRKTIALQIDSIEINYSQQLWLAVYREAKAAGCNLIIFPGGNLKSPIPLEYQRNIIYNYINPKNIDGFITVSGTMFHYLSKTDYDIQINNFSNIPKVNIGIELPGEPSIVIDNYGGVKMGLYHLKNHHNAKDIAFIGGPTGHMESQERLRAFKDFQKENCIKDSSRFVAGEAFDQPAGALAVRQLLELNSKIPDGIFCACDRLALGAMEELQRRDLEIPDDIILMGFDDTDNLNSPIASLSTVKQPLQKMASKAVNTLLNLLDGKEVERKQILPVDLVIRSSCGCFSEHLKEESSHISFSDIKAEEYDEDFYFDKKLKYIHKVANYEIEKLLKSTKKTFDSNSDKLLRRLNRFLNSEIKNHEDIGYWHRILSEKIEWLIELNPNNSIVSDIHIFLHKIRVLISEKKERMISYKCGRSFKKNIELLRKLSNQLSSAFQRKQIDHVLLTIMNKIEIKSFYSAIFNIENDNHFDTLFPTELPSTKLSVIYNNKESYSATNDKIQSGKLLPDELIPKDRRYTFIAMPLFHGTDIFGYSLFEPGPLDGSVYTTIQNQYSSALKTSNLYTEQLSTKEKLEETLVKLEQSNTLLKAESRIDQATNLLNRRGFNIIGQNNLNIAKRLNKHGMLIYGDLDNLKKINDKYGHINGDIAIELSAKALNQTFRKTDLISRFGGDEFVIMALDVSEEFFWRMESRLNQNLISLSSEHKLPYTLGITLGFVIIDSDNWDNSLKDLLETADNMLYKNKRFKKNVKISDSN